jgi:trehalose 6-phosphate synthase/phosphatase
MVRPLDAVAQRRIASTLLAAPRRALVLDYDGTLRELEAQPELAAPDGELRALLRRLAGLPGTSVHIVSGRTRATLDDWLGELDLGLGAEHGVFQRDPGGPWERAAEVSAGCPTRHGGC